MLRSTRCTIALALALGAGAVQAQSFRWAAPAYIGPCDLVTCAEAYSVTRSMARAYKGPLFQLYNGSTTLDIGQTNRQVVDLSTWSAFCSGVASNCVYSKFYSQINGGSNDLLPSVVAAQFGPDCSGGTIYKCAAPFTIEAATGLPIIATVAAQEYTKTNDGPMVGVNGGSNSISIMYNGRNVQQDFICCGVFGIAHRYDESDTIGTDFMIAFNYGTTSMFLVCATATTFCMGIDEEILGDMADFGSSVINVIASITFNSGTNRVTGILNGHSLFSRSPPAATINTGISIRIGGGGDLSQPAPTLMREAFITNSAMTTMEQSDVTSNMTAYYSTLLFP